jgi:hypothetical protein
MFAVQREATLWCCIVGFWYEPTVSFVNIVIIRHEATSTIVLLWRCMIPSGWLREVGLVREESTRHLRLNHLLVFPINLVLHIHTRALLAIDFDCIDTLRDPQAEKEASPKSK